MREVKKYKKKPIVIEAIQFQVGISDEIERFTKGAFKVAKDYGYFIDTLEGAMRVSIGDYIIEGVNGEFYPCKPDIFLKTYEETKLRTLTNSTIPLNLN